MSNRQAYINHLYRDGTPEEMAECVRRKMTLPRLRDERQRKLTAGEYLKPESPVVQPVGPIKLVIPFNELVPDGEKLGVMGGRLLLTSRYRAMKAAIQERVADEYQGPVLTSPVRLDARVFFPDARRADATNFCKLVHDALQKVVFADDSLIHDARWRYAGISPARPRAEIKVTCLAVYA